jgi:hypothetical protein
MSLDRWLGCDLDGDLPPGLYACEIPLILPWAALSVQALAEQPLVAPDPPGDLPPPSLLAALVNWAWRQQALLRLRDPVGLLAGGPVTLLDGFRLMDVGSLAARECWDQAWDAGLQVFGLSRRCCQPAGPGALAWLTALRFGGFLACNARPPEHWSEDARHSAWRLHRPEARARVVMRGGLDVVLPGADACWEDRGNEGWLRVELMDGEDCSLSQPRLVSPRRQTGLPA